MKQKPKRFLALLLCAAMMLSLMPVMAFADGEVAKIGENKYATLQDAVNAASEGETVTLLKDITQSGSAISITKGITLDFGAFTVSGVNCTTYPQSLLQIKAPGKTVTLKGTTGGIDAQAAAYGTRAISIESNCKLVINGGVYSSMNNCTIYADNANTELVMNGGSINTNFTNAGNFKQSVVIKGDLTIKDVTIKNEATNAAGNVIDEKADNAKVSIIDSKIDAKNITAVVAATSTSTVEIKGTEVTTTSAALVNGGNITIGEGTDFESTSGRVISGATSAKIEGGSFKTDSSNGAFGYSSFPLDVEGGSFEVTKLTSGSGSTNLKISGGEFEIKDATNAKQVLDNYLAPTEDGGKVQVEINEQAYTVNEEGKPEVLVVVAKIGDKNYYSLAEAFAAAKSGETIEIVKAGTYTMPEKLAADVALKSSVADKADMTKAVAIDCSKAGKIASLSTATFENVAIMFGMENDSGFGGNGQYHGFRESTSLTFNNCDFYGEIWTYASSFICNNCNFYQHKEPSNLYSLYVYGSDLVKLTDCKFDVQGKAVKIAKDGDTEAVTVFADNCDFISDRVNKPAIMYDTRYSPISVIVNNCRFNECFNDDDCEGGTGMPYWDEYYTNKTAKYPSASAVGTGIVLDGDNHITSGTLTSFETTIVEGKTGDDLILPKHFEVVPNGEGGFILQAPPAELPDNAVKVASGFYQNGATYDASSEFYITSKEGLLNFAKIVNYDFKNTFNTEYNVGPFGGKTVRLLCDVDLTGVDWEPIGNPKETDGTPRIDKACFYGNFDGGIYDESGNLIGKHTISNMTCHRENINGNKTYYVGMFGYYVANPSTIKNFVLENVDMLGYNNVAAVVGNGKAGNPTIENIDVKGTVNIKGTYPYAACVGGISGMFIGKVINCTVSGTTKIETSGTDCGGIVGQKNGGSVTGCTVDSTVTVSAAKGISAGIVGNVSAANVKVVENTCTGKQVSKSQTDTLIGNGIAYDASGKVTGGSFEKIPESMVGTGFTAYQQEDGSYIVEATHVARIGTTEYTSINAALAAAEAASEDTVITVLCDINEELTADYIFTKNVTITADEEVTVNLGFVYGKSLWAIIPGNGHTLIVDKNVNITNLGQLFSGYNPVNVSANDKLIVKGNAALQQLWVYGKSTAEIQPDAHVVMGYGDGMIKLRYGGTLNVTGNGIDSTNQQLSGGYVSGDYDGAKVLNLKETYMSTSWVTNGGAGSFAINLDNAVLKAESKVDLGANSENTINMNAGSQIITNAFSNVDTVVIDLTGATEEKYVIIDYTGSGTMTLASYGNAAITGGEYMLKVENNDLVAVKAVAKIGTTYYETFADAVAAAKDGEEIKILVGEIDLTGMKNGITVVGLVDKDGKPATTVTKIDNNYKDATLKNLVFATTQNGSKQIYGAYFDKTLFENCKFTGKNGLRMCYAKGDVTFKACVFDTTVYGAHFDGGTGNVTFDGCTMLGFNTFAASLASLTFKDCEFTTSAYNSYNVCQTHGTMSIEGETKFSEAWATPDDYTYVGTAKPTAVVTIDKDVAVENGTVVGMLGEQEGVAAIDATKDENGKFISGTFVGSKDKIDEKLAPDFHPVPNEDGSYTPAKCVFDQKNTDTKYLKTAATCTTDAVYYYSCACGEKGTETFANKGSALGHEWSAWVSDNADQHKHVCTRPGCNAFETENHTWTTTGMSEDGQYMNCKCSDCGDIKQMPISEACVSNDVIDVIAAGTYSIKIGGKDAGTITLEKASGGWYLKTAKGYLVRNGEKLSVSAEPQAWQYSYGKFFQNVTVKESRGFILWDILFGKKSISTDYYLTFDGAYGVNTTATGATVVLSNKGYFASHTSGHFRSIGNGQHEEYCANCGKSLGNVGECRYVNGVCKICGAEDPMITGMGMFDITVDIDAHNFLFFKLYTAHVYASSKIAGIRSVEFAEVRNLVYTTNSLMSTHEFGDLLIMITTTNGAVYAFYYNAQTGAIRPHEIIK